MSNSGRDHERLGAFAEKLTAAMIEWEQPTSEDSGSWAERFPFEAMARELFRLQYQSVELYRRWCDFRGVTPENLDSWHSIPTVPTSSFKTMEWTSLGPDERMTWFQSSGTTGTRRSRHFHSKESLEVYERSLIAGFRRLFPGEHEKYRYVMAIPDHNEAPHSSLAHMGWTIVRHFAGEGQAFHLSQVGGEGQWLLNPERVDAFIRSLGNDSRPVCLMGTAFSLVHLCDWLGTDGNPGAIRLPAGSRVMETGGYKGQSRELSREQLHRILENLLGLDASAVVTEYGMSELSSQAYRRPGSPPNPFLTPPWMRIRIVDPETGHPSEQGNPGIIQVFDLANIRSVMAIETEDLGSSWADGFELFGRMDSSEPKGCSLFESGLWFPPNR